MHGVIRSQNTNLRTRIDGQVANFLVNYTMDNTTGTYALTPTTYNHLLDAWAPINSWPGPPPPPPMNEPSSAPSHEPDLTRGHPPNDTAPWFPL